MIQRLTRVEENPFSINFVIPAQAEIQANEKRERQVYYPPIVGESLTCGESR